MAVKRSSYLSPFATARRLGVTRGLIGGNRGWLAVGGVFWGLHLLRRVAGRTEEVVTVERLKPGETVQIRALRPDSRRRSRSAGS